MRKNLSFRRALHWAHWAVQAVALLVLLLPAMAAQAQPAQQLTVAGVVTSAFDGEPVLGASVVVKGTMHGTTTDLDGRYSIRVDRGATLVFSYIGCETQELVPTSGTLNVVLAEANEALDEVVVVGYGVQKKKLLTGATAQVKGESIAKLNTTSPLQAMQGQMPGVTIASTSGQPGSSLKVTVRGLGTVGNSGPLYLIDGVGGDISTLNPADIESIDVLKDAASAAIYGSQAANGVVLITTKSGREGKAVVAYDGYFGIQNVARKVDLLDARQYMTIMDEQALNSGNAPFRWATMNGIHDADGNIYDTDWLGQMFKDDAQTQSHSLSITGGNAASTFAISLGYINQEGIVGGADVSDYARWNFRVNSEHKLYKDLLKVGEQVSFAYVKNTGISVGNQYNNTLRGAFNVSPIHPVYGPNSVEGDPYYDTSTSGWYDGDGNPYATMMTDTHNRSLASTLNANVYAELQPLKGLRLRTVYGIVAGSNEYRSFKPIYQYSRYSYNNETAVSQNMNRSLTMTWTNTASYDWKVGDHAFTGLLGMEASRYEGTYVGSGQHVLMEGFEDWQHAYVSKGTAATTGDGVSAAGSPHDQSRMASYFTRWMWNYQEKYMINFTLRADGSSRFARGHRWGWFPSVSGGWTLSQEQWMERSRSWLDFMKVRVSWGQVGNQDIDNFQYLAPITTDGVHYFFSNDVTSASSVLASNWGAYPSRLSNPKVKWETSEQTNVGLDVRFVQNRLGLNLDYYVKTTKDWLIKAPILAIAGTEPPFINGGDVRNTGFEWNIAWDDRIGGGRSPLNYHLSFNGAVNRNEVGNIPTEDGIIHGSTAVIYDNAPEIYRAENGKPIGYFWGFKTAGIFQNEGEIRDWIAAGNGVLQSNVQPGDVKYYDVNHDGVIDDADKVNLGNGMPDFTYGFNIALDWKGIDLSITANGAAGHQIVQSYRGFTNAKANYTTRILDRWTGEGTSNTIPRVTEQNINWQFSDLFVQDADFLRISDITVGYDLARLWKNKYCSQLRVYAQVQNAFTFTKYDGMDPEIGYGTDKWVSGIDVGYYPRPRTVLFGVNLKF